MKIKGLLDEDFVNYKKPSMFIAFPSCSFKCERESGVECCQNSGLALSPVIEVSAQSIVDRFIRNDISKAVVCGGLEPFDSFDDLIELLCHLRQVSDADFVVYTGYYEQEIADKIRILTSYKNVIVKFGRFIPNSESVNDEVLGVTLASSNQYAKAIS